MPALPMDDSEHTLPGDVSEALSSPHSDPHRTLPPDKPSSPLTDDQKTFRAGPPPSHENPSDLLKTMGEPNAAPTDSMFDMCDQGLPQVPGYQILGLLGRGGMGVVYKARQRELKRLAALKMILHGTNASTSDLARFRTESQAVAQLQHPNIVQVYEVGTTAGMPFFSLEYVDGGPLSRILNHQPQPAADAARLVLQLALAMDYAHRQGIVHRDLKPANVLVQLAAPDPLDSSEAEITTRFSSLRSAVVKIADFGLAKLLDAQSGHTQTGAILGTPNYMAPEQAAGDLEQIGPAADTHALGAILYEMLTGRPPFSGATPLETLEQVRTQDPVPPSRLQAGIPRDLQTICLKCLQKTPASRYASAGALADDLRRFLNHEPIRARRVSELERAWKWAKRRPAIAGLLAAIVVILMAGASISMYFGFEANSRAYQAKMALLEAEEQARNAALAEERARLAEKESAAQRIRADRQSADLLLIDRGLTLAQVGKVDEALHWMLASLRASPDPNFQQIVRTHLAAWSGQTRVLTHWLDAPHEARGLRPDGKLLVTAGSFPDDPARKAFNANFWDLDTGKVQGPPFRYDDTAMGTLSFSPDGKLLLVPNGGLQQHQYRPGWSMIYDVEKRKAIARVGGHNDFVERVSWSADGKRFLTQSRDRQTQVWSLSSGQPVGKLIPYDGWRFSLSPDGRWLLAAEGTTFQIWDVDSSQPVETAGKIDGQDIQSVAFAPDGRSILIDFVGLKNSERQLLVQRWDPSMGKLAGAPILRPLPIEWRNVPPEAWFPRSNTIKREQRWVFEELDGLQCWREPIPAPIALADLVRPPKQPTDMQHWRNVTQEPTSTRIWSALGIPGWIHAWDCNTGLPVGVPLPTEDTWGAPVMAVSSDGNHAVTRLNTLLLNTPFGLWDMKSVRNIGVPMPQNNDVVMCSFSPNGKLLATGGYYHTVDLWEVPTGRWLDTLSHRDMILDLAFSPDGKVLVVGTHDHKATLWNMTDLRPRVPPLKHDQAVWLVRFNRDGSRMFAYCEKAVHVWEVATGRKLGVLPHYLPATRVRFPDRHLLLSPDGKVVLTSISPGSFRLWDEESLQPLGAPTPLRNDTWGNYAFSPDSRLLASGHSHGGVQLWDVATARPLGAPLAPHLGFDRVCFDSKGKYVNAMTNTGQLRRWPVPAPLAEDVERLSLAIQLSTGLRIDRGESVVSMTRAEWEQLRDQWRQREGSADWSLAPRLSENDWLEARSRDAESANLPASARQFLERQIALAPSSWTLHARLASTFDEGSDLPHMEAAYAKAEQMGGMEAVLPWYRHRACRAQVEGRLEIADWYVNQLVRLRPQEWNLYLQRAEIREKQGRPKEVEKDLAKGLELGADGMQALQVAERLALTGRYAKAIPFYERSTGKSGLAGLPFVGHHALVCLQAQDAQAYQRIATRLLDDVIHGPIGQEYRFPIQAMVYATLGPAGSADWDKPLAHLQTIIDQVTKLEKEAFSDRKRSLQVLLHTLVGLRGAMLYRKGRYAEAIESLKAGLVESSGTPMDWVFLTLAYHKAGQTSAAQTWLAKLRAAKALEPRPLVWDDMLISLRDELKEIGDKQKP